MVADPYVGLHLDECCNSVFPTTKMGSGPGVKARTGWHLSLRTLSEALRHRQGRWKYCKEIIRYRNPASDNGPQPSGGPAPLLAR